MTLKINLIDNNESLKQLCSLIQKQSLIALDTEFVRRDTYFAILSLVQIAFCDEVYIADALKCDISQLIKSISDSKATLIMHSARQDLDIFHTDYKYLPNNIFDTQIASKLCGYREFIGYADLCEKICDVKLDKTHQASNWLLRDLSQEMLFYAACDVIYLERIYHFLNKIIDEKNMHESLKSDTFKILLNDQLYDRSYENAWKRVKFSTKVRDLLPKMKVIAAFREENAVTLNIPRRNFATDKQMVQMCNMLPTDMETLKKIKGLSGWIKQPKTAEKLFNICSGLKEVILANAGIEG